MIYKLFHRSWAKCLYDRPRDTSNELDVWKYNEYPGILYTAKDQCEVLLRDHEAYEFVNGDFSQVCENLHCRTPNRPGFFFAGPALAGTLCGSQRWCDGGKCEIKTDFVVSTSTTIQPNHSCKSECLEYGKGVQKLKGHDGSNDFLSTIRVCDDSKICKTRKTVVGFGTQMCKEFSKTVPEVDGIRVFFIDETKMIKHILENGLGLQASYDSSRVWMSCAIYCKKTNATSYFTPRIELNKHGLNPYYPDGTLCHSDGNESFYCISYHCLPEV